MKNGSFQSPEVVSNRISAFYLENKTRALVVINGLRSRINMASESITVLDATEPKHDRKLKWNVKTQWLITARISFHTVVNSVSQHCSLVNLRVAESSTLCPVVTTTNRFRIDFDSTTNRFRFDCDSTAVRLQFVRAATIERPTLWPSDSCNLRPK